MGNVNHEAQFITDDTIHVLVMSEVIFCVGSNISVSHLLLIHPAFLYNLKFQIFSADLFQKMMFWFRFLVQWTKVSQPKS